MRRLRIALVTTTATAVTLLAFPALPAQATVETNTQRGPYAEAFFSGEPAQPAPGDFYREITVYANDFAATGNEDPGPLATVSIKRYVATSEGGPEFISETMTGMPGEGVSFTTNRHLNVASLTVTFEASKTCLANGECTKSGGGTVTLSWTATGTPVTSVTTNRTVDPAHHATYTSYERRVSRDATATGTVFGLPLTESRSADISHYNYRERLVTH